MSPIVKTKIVMFTAGWLIKNCWMSCAILWCIRFNHTAIKSVKDGGMGDAISGVGSDRFEPLLAVLVKKKTDDWRFSTKDQDLERD